MSDISRQTIIFFLPLQLEALTGNVNSYSVTHPGHPDGDGNVDPDEIAEITEANTGSDGDLLWSRKQLYMNPQTINIRDKKFIKSDLTKGGFVTQYWGEDLTSIEVNGTTGSSGIEGISVLRGIYRHEQTQYRHVLYKRNQEQAAIAKALAAEAEALLKERTGLGGTLTNVLDVFTGGAYTQTMDGLSNTIDRLAAPFTGGAGTASSTGSFKGIPSLAAFATNIDMYHQGEFFRGYFENFSVTENAQEPGLFTYQFTFKVTRRTGERTNFMPWHRSPHTADGETRMTDSTTTSKGLVVPDEFGEPGPGGGAQHLTFPLTDPGAGPEFGGFGGLSLNKTALEARGYVNSEFSDQGPQSKDKNEVGVSRKKDLTGK